MEEEKLDYGKNSNDSENAATEENYIDNEEYEVKTEICEPVQVIVKL